MTINVDFQFAMRYTMDMFERVAQVAEAYLDSEVCRP